MRDSLDQLRMNSPQILFVGAETPWAASGGHHVRQMMLLDGLSRLGKLHLAMFARPDQRIDPPAGRFASLTWLDLPGPNERTNYGFVRDIICPTPRMLRILCNTSAISAVKTLRAQIPFSLIFSYRIDFCTFAGLRDEAQLILDVDDPEHIRRRRGHHVRGDSSLTASLDLIKLRRSERKAARRARMAFACNKVDAAAFAPPLSVLPNTVPTQKRPNRDPIPERLMVVGNCEARNGANADGVSWFLRKIWPKLTADRPSLTLRVIGRGSDRIVREAGCPERVTGMGFVENLSEEYARAALVVAPIRFGTGTRVKILEAMSYACPVVATPAAWVGIDAKPGDDLVSADGEENMISEIHRLLDDVDSAGRIGEGAWECIRTKYNRDEVICRLRGLLRPIVRESARELARGLGS